MPSRSIIIYCAIGALAAWPAAEAQEAQTLKDAAGAIATTAAADTIEPGSLEALKTMGAYLAQLDAFDLSSQFEAELSLDNDQKVEIGGTTHYLARRPDRLKVELTSDLGNRSFLYDGSSLYIVAADDQVYGQLDEVGGAIKDMLESVATYADVEVPLADLFDYGTDDAPSNAITEGFLVGPSTVGGKASKHWAYRTGGKDFQVWIADGDKPLPLKIVVEDDAAPTRPQFEAELTWGDNPDVADSAFAFTPPAGATEIPVLVRQDTAEAKP